MVYLPDRPGLCNPQLAPGLSGSSNDGLQGKQNKEATLVQQVAVDEVANGMATLLMKDKNNTTKQATLSEYVVQVSAAAVQPVSSPTVSAGEKEL